MPMNSRLFVTLAILALSNVSCVVAQSFATCFNGVFLPCTSNRCVAASTVQTTINSCGKIIGAPLLRQCTSNGFTRCATRTGAKSTFTCTKAVNNYLFNTASLREKNACLAMKPPCQELMKCDACGTNNCTAPTTTKSPTKVPTRSPTKKPTAAPVKPPTKSPTKKPTSSPVKPPTKSPTKKPTASPVKPPTKAPTKKPTTAPVKSPTKAPTKTPTSSPVKPPTKAPTKAPAASPVKPPTKAPTKTPTSAPVTPTTKGPTKQPSTAKAPTKKPTVPRTKIPTKSPTKSPLTVVADLGPPGDIADCTTPECQQRATCCTQSGGRLLSGGCINCLPLVYGGFYRCGFCDTVAFPGNKESCASFSVGSEWLRCEMPSGDTCNVQFCSWAGLPNISDCTATC